ncbi:MAG TPA: GNAT family N-acetyltransferase, partial [Allocoleopsis sp.]
IHQKAEFDGHPEGVEATAEELEQTLFGDRPLATVLFAEVDGIPVGYALFFQTYSSFLAQPSLWLDDLFVQAPFRNRGIGTALIHALTQEAQRRNCGRVEWTVSAHNPHGITFYQKINAQVCDDTWLCRKTLETPMVLHA